MVIIIRVAGVMAVIMAVIMAAVVIITPGKIPEKTLKNPPHRKKGDSPRDS